MNILAFDTSLDKTYIALEIDNETKTAAIKSDETNYHSAYLIPEIKKMGFCPNKIDAIAINAGPGSFTGIRAGLSVAKVMAQELNLPVVPLNSCEILKSASEIDDAVVLLDARRLMYYFYDGDKIELILKEDVKSKIKNYTVICDSGVESDFSSLCENKFINYEKQNYPLDKVILKLAKKKLEASKNTLDEFSHTKLKANYIQTPPVFKK